MSEHVTITMYRIYINTTLYMYVDLVKNGKKMTKQIVTAVNLQLRRANEPSAQESL